MSRLASVGSAVSSRLLRAALHRSQSSGHCRRLPQKGDKMLAALAAPSLSDRDVPKCQARYEAAFSGGAYHWMAVNGKLLAEQHLQDQVMVGLCCRHGTCLLCQESLSWQCDSQTHGTALVNYELLPALSEGGTSFVGSAGLLIHTTTISPMNTPRSHEPTCGHEHWRHDSASRHSASPSVDNFHDENDPRFNSDNIYEDDDSELPRPLQFLYVGRKEATGPSHRGADPPIGPHMVGGACPTHATRSEQVQVHLLRPSDLHTESENPSAIHS